MIIKTIELIPNSEELTIESLQSQIDNGDFDDILSKYSFLIMTNKGIVLVKKEDDNVSIVSNPLVDLSNYVLKENVESQIHIHANQDVLNSITPEMIDALNNLINAQ